MAIVAVLLYTSAARGGSDHASIVENSRTIPVTHRADVVVVGAGDGGLGGCMAAIAAARHGASVILVEESSTIGLHVPIALGVVIGVNGWKPTIHEGLFREFAETVSRTGQYAAEPMTPEQTLARGEMIIRYHDVVSTAMVEMLQKAGVQMLFHTKFCESVVEGGKMKAIIVESPQGRHAIAGKVFIDSTGLGDLAASAGAPMLREEPYMSVQAFIGKVDEAAYRKWIDADKSPLDESYRAWIEKQVGPIAGQYHPWAKWWRQYLGERMPAAVVRKVRAAQERGEINLIWRRGEKGILAIVEGIKAEGDVAMPRTYITGIDPLNADDVSWAETTSRIALMEFQRFLRQEISGFEESVMERVADTVSLRGGRYLQIPNQITADQIDHGAKSADWVIYVFVRGKGIDFEVPYRALVPEKVDGLLVVGKATAGGVAMRTAHGVLFQGQAAGTAAAIAVKEAVLPRNVAIVELRSTLKADGVAIPYPATTQATITIDGHAQLLLDDYLIARSANLKRVVHQPEVDSRNPVLTYDKPWEFNCVTLWGSVIYDEQDRVFKMWYQTWGNVTPPKQSTFVCYATSKDGLKWDKPDLGLIAFEGNAHTNIVMSPREAWLDSPTVVKDLGDPDPAKRYKMAWCESGPNVVPAIYHATSPDGVNWQRMDAAVVYAGDRNALFYDEPRKKWIVITRMPGIEAQTIAFAEGHVFGEYDPMRLIFAKDDKDPADSDLYSMPTFMYEGVRIGCVEVYDHPSRREITQLAWSNDGEHWTRDPERQPFMLWGEKPAWDWARRHPATSLPIVRDGKLWIYFGGRSTLKRSEDPRHVVGAIGLSTLRIDGFSSRDAGAVEGTMTTKPVVMKGSELVVNANGKSDGELAVDVCDDGGNVITHASLNGDRIDHRLPLPKEVSRGPVELKFVMKNAELYSFRVR